MANVNALVAAPSASIISAAELKPRLIADLRMQVGLVTLISVK